MGSFLSSLSWSSSSPTVLDMPAIVTSTANNYQDRFEKFSAWADEDDNALPAQKCRELLLEALRTSTTTNACHGKEEFISIGQQQQQHEQPLSSSSDPCSNSRTCCPPPPIRLLDAGCGPGRDLEAFAGTTIHNRRIEVHGFDACPGFVMQCHGKGLSHVVQADFTTYFDVENDPKDNDENDDENYTKKQFDAIFSLAALFHVPREQLRHVLVSFRNHLNSNNQHRHSSNNNSGGSSGGGYLLISLPHGNRNELGKDGRWMHYMPKRQQIQLLKDVGFEILATRKISQYNGHDWIVTLCKKK